MQHLPGSVVPAASANGSHPPAAGAEKAGVHICGICLGISNSQAVRHHQQQMVPTPLQQVLEGRCAHFAGSLDMPQLPAVGMVTAPNGGSPQRLQRPLLWCICQF